MFKHSRNSLGLIAYEPRSGSTIISKFITENTHAIAYPSATLSLHFLLALRNKIINSQVKDGFRRL